MGNRESEEVWQKVCPAGMTTENLLVAMPGIRDGSRSAEDLGHIMNGHRLVLRRQPKGKESK